MRKNNDKLKQYSIIAVLVVICVGLLGLIFSVDQRTLTDQQMIKAGQEVASLTVAELDCSEDGIVDSDENTIDSKVKVEVEGINTDSEAESKGELSEIIVEPIEADEDMNSEIVSYKKEEIEVPVADEPEKPVSTPPEKKPETSDDLTNPDIIPEYDEVQTTYVPEPETEGQEDEVRGSNQVPDSENPFLHDNVPSNGDMGEMMGEDYDEGAPSGEGDKF